MTASRSITVDGWAKPIPQPDNVSEQYWAACARGELLVQECPDCGARQFYPRALCTACGGEPRWLTTAGRGTIHTFTVIRQYGDAPVPRRIALCRRNGGAATRAR